MKLFSFLFILINDNTRIFVVMHIQRDQYCKGSKSKKSRLDEAEFVQIFLFSLLFVYCYSNIDDYMQVLEREVNIDFCRSMNRIIFDKTVKEDPKTFAFVKVPATVAKTTPARGDCSLIFLHSFICTHRYTCMHTSMHAHTHGSSPSKLMMTLFSVAPVCHGHGTHTHKYTFIHTHTHTERFMHATCRHNNSRSFCLSTHIHVQMNQNSTSFV